MYNLRKYFNLDRKVTFLNHGSFGATPKPVFDVYIQWQTRLEKQPVKFLGREYDDLMNWARQSLASELGTAANNLAFVPNATHGVNIAARSIALQPGDEILSTDHEYGACEFAWDAVCKMTGAVYVKQAIPLPVPSQAEIASTFLAGINERTKVIFISHITSPTAVRFPVEVICKVAREKGITTVIDGAHAYGQISLELDKLGADFYTSNCHKWALSPKGAAFLFVNPAWQGRVDPIIVSWGYGTENLSRSGSRFVDLLQWSGTKDPSAALTVPASIEFRMDHEWEKVRTHAKEILDDAIARIIEMPGYQTSYNDPNNYTQMVSIQIPDLFEVGLLKEYLYDQYLVELPVLQWNGRKLIRVSINGYNTEKDIDTLIKALKNAGKHFGSQLTQGAVE